MTPGGACFCRSGDVRKRVPPKCARGIGISFEPCLLSLSLIAVVTPVISYCLCDAGYGQRRKKPKRPPSIHPDDFRRGERPGSADRWRRIEDADSDDAVGREVYRCDNLRRPALDDRPPFPRPRRATDKGLTAIPSLLRLRATHPPTASAQQKNIYENTDPCTHRIP